MNTKDAREMGFVRLENATELRAENERLKAYLGDAQAWEAHLRDEIRRLDNVWRDMSDEIVDLKAEIERLREFIRYTMQLVRMPSEWVDVARHHLGQEDKG